MSDTKDQKLIAERQTPAYINGETTTWKSLRNQLKRLIEEVKTPGKDFILQLIELDTSNKMKEKLASSNSNYDKK